MPRGPVSQLTVAAASLFAAAFVVPQGVVAQSADELMGLHDHLEYFWNALDDVPPPREVYSNADSVATSCRSADGSPYLSWNVPAYCPADGTIYFSPRAADHYRDTKGISPLFILAHEWGHHVQAYKGYNPEFGIKRELQADCYAGYFFGFHVSQGRISEQEAATQYQMAFAIGAQEVWTTMGAHGSGGERADAYMWGFGGKSCEGNLFERFAGGSVPKFEVEGIAVLADQLPRRVGTSFSLNDVAEAESHGASEAVRGRYYAPSQGFVVLDVETRRYPDAETAFAALPSVSAAWLDQGGVISSEGDITGNDGSRVGRFVRWESDGFAGDAWQKRPCDVIRNSSRGIKTCDMRLAWQEGPAIVAILGDYHIVQLFLDEMYGGR